MATKKADKKVTVPAPDLMPQAEAARVLGITRAGVSWLVAQGRLTPVEMWGRQYVLRTSVEAYKEQRNSKAKLKSTAKGKRKA